MPDSEFEPKSERFLTPLANRMGKPDAAPPQLLTQSLQKSGARTPEPFVDADAAARFLSVTRRRVMELARAGSIPAFAMGNGQRRTWLFKLSFLAETLESRLNCDRQSPAPESEN